MIEQSNWSEYYREYRYQTTTIDEKQWEIFTKKVTDNGAIPTDVKQNICIGITTKKIAFCGRK